MIAMRIVRNAAREDGRLSGISICSKRQYAANAVDPRVGFTFLSIVFPGHFPCRNALKWQDVNLALAEAAQKKFKKELA